MSSFNNRNFEVCAQAARDLGATSVTFEKGKKHIIVRVMMPANVEAKFTVSYGPIEPYKLKGWTRQAINRAIARAA